MDFAIKIPMHGTVPKTSLLCRQTVFENTGLHNPIPVLLQKEFQYISIY